MHRHLNASDTQFKVKKTHFNIFVEANRIAQSKLQYFTRIDRNSETFYEKIVRKMVRFFEKWVEKGEQIKIDLLSTPLRFKIGNIRQKIIFFLFIFKMSRLKLSCLWS